MAKNMMLTEDEAIELFTFLVVAARTQLDDPHHYASMRLLTAAERLRDFMTERASPDTQELLNATVDKSERAQIIMNDTDAFAGVLDELCAMVAQFLVERNNLQERTK
jgi:hypothetical protein